MSCPGQAATRSVAAQSRDSAVLMPSKVLGPGSATHRRGAMRLVRGTRASPTRPHTPRRSPAPATSSRRRRALLAWRYGTCRWSAIRRASAPHPAESRRCRRDGSPDGPAFGLNAADTGDDVEGLPERMMMPVGACARLERDTRAVQPCRRGRHDHRVLPDGAGEIFLGRAAGQPRACNSDLHWDYLASFPITSCLLRSAPWSRRSWDRGPGAPRHCSPR